MMHLDNPILTRLMRQPGSTTAKMFWRVVGALFTLAGLIVWAAWRRGWPVALYNYLVPLACMSGLFLMMLLATTAAIITLRETRNEQFQLLFLTRITPRRLVWGITLGVLYRLRTYATITVWAIALAGWPLLIISRYALYDGIASLSDEGPSLVEGAILLLIWLVGGAGVVFMVIANTVVSSLRTRRTLRAAVLTVGGAFGLSVIGIMLTMVMGDASGIVPLLVGLLLALVPYLLGFALAHYWELPWTQLVIATTYVPFALFWITVFAFIIRTSLTFRGTASDFGGVFIILYGMAMLLALIIIVRHWRRAVAARSAVFLAWMTLLAVLVMQTFRQDDRILRSITVSILQYGLVILPYGLGLSALESARRFRFP